MSLFRVFKRNAKLALKGSWSKSILIVLILLGVSLLVSALQGGTTALLYSSHGIPAPAPLYEGELTLPFPLTLGLIIGFTILSLLLVAPLELGSVRWHLQLVHGRSEPVSEVFCFFESGSRYARSIGYYFQLLLRQLLWSVVFFALPLGGFAASLWPHTQTTPSQLQLTATTFGILLSSLLMLLASVFYSIFMMKYALVPYYLAQDPDRKISEAFSLSIAHTKGHRFRLFLFTLSFFGWLLLSVLVVPMLFVLPYYQTALSMYARYLMEKAELPPAPSTSTQEFVVDTRAPYQDFQRTTPKPATPQPEDEKPSWPAQPSHTGTPFSQSPPESTPPAAPPADEETTD